MSRRTYIWFITLFTCIFISTGCASTTEDMQSNAGDPIVVTTSAAVSLTDALEEMKENYEANHNVELTFNVAGSGTLAQQIQQGAPIDLFLSANQQWMDMLADDSIIDPSTRTDVTGNQLVLVAHQESSLSYQSFADISPGDVDMIAVGNPDSVPAGAYTKEALQSLDLWDDVEDRVVLAKDVRQVLTYVETGNADIGFVYESDARNSDDVTIIATAEEGLHDPIIYPGAVIADSNHPEEAQAFLDYMLSADGQEILAKYGFNK